MPRNHPPGASTLRNRNRITNKSRLKILFGNIEGDALLIPDEDEEKHRLTNLVAGVDAEDANEHHLQEVLSATQQHGPSRPTRGAAASQAPAFIPTPDSTGIVDNYEELYPSTRWKDPTTYVCTSQIVEEAITNGLANGFTYYIDERDKEWLDKNNEEARGEGTSAQGAISTSSTRTSARSAKVKGKEPESSLPIVISEDEFELVMGLFEKVTHERTEFLHHSFDVGMAFPAFSDYQDAFASPLTSATFATYIVPAWIPPPATLLRIARAIYPYWKERRTEREGHRIIPTLNADESDTANESYICFRRREIKAVRKTRASQATSSDKLARLHAELSYPLEMAKAILTRENRKRECAHQAQAVWEKRLAFVDLKRRFPAFVDKADDELLIDKEKPGKKPDASRVTGLKIGVNDLGIPLIRPEISIKPKERLSAISHQIETILARQRDIDHQWEDCVDDPYQPPQVPYASRLFKYIPPPNTPSWPSNPASDAQSQKPRRGHALRIRYGRGGRVHIDRRNLSARPITYRARPPSPFNSNDGMVIDDDGAELEARRRLEEQWKFDADDMPAVGPEGSDEQDRVLVDDYDLKYLKYRMSLFSDIDHHHHIVTDPSLLIQNAEGRQQMILPFRLGMPPFMRRDAQGATRACPPGTSPTHPLAMVPVGTPISMQHHIRKMPPPSSIPQMRISSNGGMRPSVIPVSNLQTNGLPTVISPPHSLPIPSPHQPSPNGTSGMARPAISMPHVDLVKPDLTQIGSVALQQSDSGNPALDGDTPSRPKSQNQQQMVSTNGFHLTPMTPIAAAALANTTQATGQRSLSLQQVQELKSAFANLPTTDFTPANGRTYMQIPNGNHMGVQMPIGNSMNSKLSPAKQMQWSMGTALQRTPTAMNVVDAQALNGSTLNAGHAQVPVRPPSMNGPRPMVRNGVQHINGHMPSSPLQASPSPAYPAVLSLQANDPLFHSLPHPPMTPASSTLQNQQAVGGTQSGY
ncbi:uncharacterized protein LACBIDRAFT_293698 [Laccaria bicolor S238N-H82]|uniref:Enhancer of polycomb-like protein n=1 Tax=Laccaria bicolor (strain S238N-H82 / ATCC MYA-4686) TaxID=486041 RepID=B0D5M5_LACBS|nr:uncharacterized protein LACBIDRAFT_293698 [Laccaria bicolor S238N-H82]EDR09801.1 predicted protein [Laccaria bicolor S238N-H82]|eukprot:XP_001879186.1 predicted protein [Laccaria bicolor S238N-H82]